VSAAAKEKPVGFVVPGEFITDHARDRVFEYGWEDGLRFLTECLHGKMTYEQMVELLAGRMRLTGEDGPGRPGLDFVAETEEKRHEVTDRYRRLYAGIFYERSSRKNWRPYAYVDGWSSDDVAGLRVENKYHGHPRDYSCVAEACGGNLTKWSLARNVYYMKDPVNDRVYHVNIPGLGQCTTLWEVVPSPPLWWKQLTRPELAAVEYVAAGGRLERRGAAAERDRKKEYGEQVEKPFRDKNLTNAQLQEMSDRRVAEREAKDESDDDKKKDFFRSLIPAGTPDHVADGLVRSMTDEGDYPDPQPTEDLKTPWAWVSPEGVVWPARGYMDHIPLAHALGEKFHARFPNKGNYGGNAEKMLEDYGWAKVGRYADDEPKVYCEKHPTDKQFDVILSWLAAQGADRETVEAWAEKRS
jgi:hypothetical protein